MSTVTTQNLRSTTTKTQIVTYTSCSSKPRPKLIMLLLHKSKPKPIDWLRQRRIGDVRGGYGFAGVRDIFDLVDRVHAGLEFSEGERREEKGENSPDWRQSVGGRRTFNEVWGGAASLYRRCVGVELRWAWGWVSGCVRSVWEKCVRSDQSGNLLKVKWKGKFIYGMGTGKLILQSNWFLFLVWLYFQVIPNTHPSVKHFQSLVYMRNRHSFNDDSRTNQSSGCHCSI